MSGYPSAPGFGPPPYPASGGGMAMPIPGNVGSMPMPGSAGNMPMPGGVGNMPMPMPMPVGTGPKPGDSPANIPTQPPYNPTFLPPQAEGQGGGYPPTGYPPTGSMYPPGGPGYPPSGPGYPSSGPGYPPSGPGYPTGGPGYPPVSPYAPPGAPISSQPTSYGGPAEGQGYPPAGYPPTGPVYPPGGPGYPSSGPGYPSSGPGYPSDPGYPPSNPYAPPPGAPPISSQPTTHGAPDGGGWMNVPQSRPVDCPPGLEYLATLDQFLVHQKVELLEAIVGFETQNKFDVKNSMGQKVYKAKEKSGCCVRCCCGPNRPFSMKIMDNFQNEVIHLKRPFAFQTCFCPCWLQSMEVYAPPGNFIGSVEQEWSLFTPQYSIKNAAGDTVLRVEGPCCTFSFCGDVEFKVLALDGETVVGNIRKQWSGLLREAFTDADHFGVTFPMDLDVKMKAVMLGACFLIDAMFFEKKGNKESDRPGMFEFR